MDVKSRIKQLNLNPFFMGAVCVLLGFLFTPAFIYGVVSLWAVPFLFVFIHLGRALCWKSLRRYEENLKSVNESPKIKGMVIALCTYLSLPFMLYIYFIGDLNNTVSSGLDRALILSLPLSTINLPIDGEPRVFQMLLLLQLLLSIFGFGIGMLYARKEIAALSLPKLPKNISVREDMTDEERNQHANLWLKYEALGGVALMPAIVGMTFASIFYGRFWDDNNIHVLENVLILLCVFLMSFVVFFEFFAIAVIKITGMRM